MFDETVFSRTECFHNQGFFKGLDPETVVLEAPLRMLSGRFQVGCRLRYQRILPIVTNNKPGSN